MSSPGSTLTRSRALLLLAGVVLLVFGPLLLGNYHQYILSLILVNVIIAVGLNLLIGNAGQISLCSSAFMGIGAYTTVYCMTEGGIPFWFALPIGGLAAALFGLLLGAPAVRVRGFYLAVVTLAFLEIIQVIIREIPAVTGGVRGLLAPRPEIFGFSFAQDLRFYYVVLLVAALAVYCAHSLLRSPIGRQFNAVRNNETVAYSLGISVVRVKLLAFVVSAFYAGIGGGLFAALVGFIDPLEFGLLTSIQHVIFIVVGGLGSIVGAILGASILTALPEFLRGLKEYNEFFFGGLLILVLIGLPHGLVSLGRSSRVLTRWRGRRRAGGSRPDEVAP